jgi:flagellin-specific chaperone FliS
MTQKKIKKTFEKLISLYDICDELENMGEEKSSKEMRKTLNDLSKFIVSLMKTN